MGLFGLSSLTTTLIGGAALALVSFSGGAYSGYRWELGTVEQLRAADATATALAVKDAATRQKAADVIALTDSSAEGVAQVAIKDQTLTVTKEITRYVPQTVACIPNGLVRVLNAAATGADPASVAYAPGQPDDACAALSWRDFASDLTDDYGAGRANAEQLNALEADIRAQSAAIQPRSDRPL